ncbi:MAG: hypothetical protein AAGE84_26415, partial [Cyanobacteria bacterium P01_G01_bin.39]
MKSAKIVNKILLISLACGSATFVAAMLVGNENFKKALVGFGGTASMAGIAGALIINGKQDQENQSNLPIDSQKSELKQSFNEATVKMQAVEADINSLQAEHNQLLSIVSDLNSQKQQLEVEYASKKQEIEAASTDISVLEKHKQDLESDHNNLKQEIQELSLKHEQLEQVIAPIEESLVDLEVKDRTKSTTVITSTPELEVDNLIDSIDASELEVVNNELIASQDSIQEANKTTNNADEDIDPFASFEESSEFADDQDTELEMVDKLIGEFDESELEMFEQKPSEANENSIQEESDSELDEPTDESISEIEEEAESDLGWEPEAIVEESEPSLELESAISDESISEIEEEAESDLGWEPEVVVEESESEPSLELESAIADESTEEFISEIEEEAESDLGWEPEAVVEESESEPSLELESAIADESTE